MKRRKPWTKHLWGLLIRQSIKDGGNYYACICGAIKSEGSRYAVGRWACDRKVSP